MYHCYYLKSCKLFKVGTKHVKWVSLQVASIHEYSIVNSREYLNTIKTRIVSALVCLQVLINAQCHLGWHCNGNTYC